LNKIITVLIIASMNIATKTLITIINAVISGSTHSVNSQALGNVGQRWANVVVLGGRLERALGS